MTRFKFKVDGKTVSVDASPETPLLYALRGELGMHNPKFGCGLGQCGACTVHLDGVAVRSCTLPVSAVKGKEVTTLAGLGTPEHPHPLQAAFVEEQVPQCGYCTGGMIMRSAALLSENKKPTEEQVRAALDGNLCRCGTHVRVVRAVMAASGQGG